ncbi:ABC transporter substrate-binding protein [Candidatus Nitrosocosmicus arcticus]|uniref:ABC transporter substrate-binding protein n=1 Tax=Candidatus Nitrosocosmicus arcticus TaxID=2035267 RepID=UPI001648FCA2|nr:ABC transporter substrate-binding protein [Candidatus Nitrosocosmicus arcticus]
MTALFAIVLCSSENYAFSQMNKTGGYADQVKFIRFSNENVAYQEVTNGHLDSYFFQIPLHLVESAKKNSNLEVFEKEGLSYGLLINPYNASQTFNPFSIKEIRFAMNFLIDRNFIVNNILKGFSNPIVEPYGPTSPEYHNVIPVVDPLKIHYDLTLATKSIKDSMIKAGAIMDGTGKYTLNGKAVLVKILIRNDDLLRKSFGDFVASEVEKVGFTVVKEYGDLTKANRVVYGSDPADLEWNVYTESYISSSFSRYNPTTVSQMYAPWFGNMPGSQNPVFWQYSNSTIDDLTQKLVFNNFTSEIERNNLLRQAESAGLQEAVRLFFARSFDPYISSSKISGLINDYSAGIANKLSLINAIKNNTDNSTLNIGMKEVYQGAWNNVKGCTDFYCRIIYSLVADTPTISNPYSGDPEPSRNMWTYLFSKGPTDTVIVPSDALTWNPFNQSWDKNKNQSNSALTKVTMTPLFSNWHNGELMDKYDLLYSYYFPFEWSTDTKNNDKTFDAEYSSLIFPTLSLIKGIKFYDNNTFDTYVDLWHYDKKLVPSYGTLWPSEPWEITAATERLVADNKLSYSKSDANIKHIDQLSLNLPVQSELIKRELIKMSNENYVPNPLKGLISLEYALERYKSSIDWINIHHNAVIGNGPYYLETFNPTGGVVTLNAFRDNTYPFKTGIYSDFENPPELRIDRINIPKFLKIGDPYDFDLLLGLNNLSNGSNSFSGIIDHFISDRNNKIVVEGSTVINNISNNHSDSKGQHQLDESGAVTISLNASQTQELIPGPAKIKLIITSTESPKPLIQENTLIARP